MKKKNIPVIIIRSLNLKTISALKDLGLNLPKDAEIDLVMGYPSGDNLHVLIFEVKRRDTYAWNPSVGPPNKQGMNKAENQLAKDVEILNATNLPERFCDVDTISPGAQCMDNNPSVKCWGGEHRAYISLVIILLVPYYMATLELQSAAQARQSVCKIDGGWSVVSTQSKFMLAFVASSFGSCYPIVSSVARVSATHTGRSV